MLAIHIHSKNQINDVENIEKNKTKSKVDRWVAFEAGALGL